MDKLYIGNNWSKTLNKLEWNTCGNADVYLSRKTNTFQEWKFTKMKPNLRLRILNCHLKLVYNNHLKCKGHLYYVILLSFQFKNTERNFMSLNNWGVLSFTLRAFLQYEKVSHRNHYTLIYLCFGKVGSCVESQEHIPEQKKSHNGPRTRVSSHIRSLLFTMSLIVIVLCL